MKSIRLKATAAKIEYHWRCIARLERRHSDKRNAARGDGSTVVALRYHKYQAKMLSCRYEILAGIRNTDGEFAA